LVSEALALDPDYAWAHLRKSDVLTYRGRLDESIAEAERALALDPSLVTAYGMLGENHLLLGQFEKSLEYYDRAIRLSPHDPSSAGWREQKAADYFGLKQYDQAIESARQSIAISPDNPLAYFNLIAALALTGHEAEAGEALQRYFASFPRWPKTIAAWKAAPLFASMHASPRDLESLDRHLDGLRKAGMPGQ
jgi:adenylate cyclase